MHHYVYRIVNLLNGKIYVGKHSTADLDDDYMGSGKLLVRAIRKYGRENFRKEILAMVSSAEEADLLERAIVTEEFVLRDDTYNMTTGGKGGWLHVNRNEKLRRDKNNKAAQSMNDANRRNPNFHEEQGRRLVEIMKRMRDDGTFPKISLEVYAKIGKLNSVRMQGSGNPMFGKVWIHHPIRKQSIRVDKRELETFLSEGWIRGRKMNFK